MPLGTETGLGPGDIVLDGTQLPHAQQPPLFGPRLLWPNGRPSQQLLSSCMHLGPEGRSHGLRCRAVRTGVSVKSSLISVSSTTTSTRVSARIRAYSRLVWSVDDP